MFSIRNKRKGRLGIIGFAFWLMLFALNSISAQNSAVKEKKGTREIKGIVKDELGNLLPGVSVTLNKGGIGVLSNENGAFILNVPESTKSLIFNQIGYSVKEVDLASNKVGNLTVVLVKAFSELDEVVVIGYGTTKRKDLTGSVVTVKPKDSDGQLFPSVDNLLRGRAAGVQVQQSSGDPGSAVSVKIRGVGSLRGDNEPLYVVDGVIINNVTTDNSDPLSTKTANTGQIKQSGLTGINPQDIESLEILKDASATAIYGSRGANGVVIITTKQGRGKVASIRFTSFLEFSNPTKKLHMLDANGYASYMNQIQNNNGLSPIYGLDTLQNVDWQNEMERTAVTSNHRLTISGASADNKSKYFIAGGFINNQGIVNRTGYNQTDLKMNLNQDLSPRLKMNFMLSGVYLKNSMTQSTEATGSGDNSMIMKMIIGNPIRNANASLDNPSIAYDNPLSWLNGYDDNTEEKRIIAGLGFTYRISNVFSYKLNLAVDNKSKERIRWFGKQTFTGKNANGLLGLSQFDRKFYQIENLLLYNKKINKNNALDGTLGVTYDDENINSSTILNENFFTEELRGNGFGFGQLLYPYFRNRLRNQVFSVLGRLNYTYKEKYIMTLSGRSDGSSKFAAGNKFSFFPAAALAWKISNEDFLKKSKYISDMKLRIGYGRSGNQAIDPYSTYARYGQTYSVNGNTLISGAVPLNIQNKQLKWETTDQFNAGLDVALFNGSFSFSIEGYYKKTNDLLQTFTIPASSGYQSIVKNIGSIQNSGIEISANATIINKKEFQWIASANISFNRNKITDIGLPDANFGQNVWQGYIGPNVSTGTYFKDPANIFIVGQPIGMFYGYQTNGVYKTGDNITGIKQFGLPVKYGDIRMVDQNKDNNVDANDKVLIGNPNPKFNFGFNTGFIYNKLSLDLFFNGSYGSQVANGNLMRIANLNGTNGGNVLASAYYNAWTATNNESNDPRVGYDNLSFIDRYVEDASFLRLASATLSYKFSGKSNNLIKAVTFSISGKNIFTISKYSGFDPDVNSFSFDKGRIGVDWASYPNLRSVSAAISVNF